MTGGAVTERATYRLAGQLIAVRVRTDPTNSGVVTYTYTDHLGSVVAMTGAAGGANPVTPPAATPAPPQT